MNRPSQSSLDLKSNGMNDLNDVVFCPLTHGGFDQYHASCSCLSDLKVLL